MIKKTKSISINIISAFIILICLFLGAVGNTNAWFTDTYKQGVVIEVDVGNLNLKVYQNSISTTNEIFDKTKNTEYETDTNTDGSLNTETDPQYVTLSGEIKPDTAINLKLILASEDKGSVSMYVRFKFELYARGVSADTKIEGVTISGYDTASSSISGNDTVKSDGSMKESQNGFVYNSSDGYYYYQQPQTEEGFKTASNALFEKGEIEVMLTSFTVPYSAFVNSDGSFKFSNSDTVYIKLTIQVDIAQNFANSSAT